MSDSDDLYRVMYIDADGHEQLTGAMPLDAAQARAKALEGRGYAVGSVMGDVAARGYMHARYAPTYRGVKVPGGLRADGQPRNVYEAWKRGVDATLEALGRETT
jgi:NAD(P)-dependent dehydrogenase (short-subunit alcohol dehydrogenase family)